MSKIISVVENGINMVIEVDDNHDVRLLHFSPFSFDGGMTGNESFRKVYRAVELQVSGEDQDDHHGSKHIGTMPGNILKYVSHKDFRNNMGRKLEITMEAQEISLTIHYQFISGVPVIRSWTEVTNNGPVSKGLEYVSSFSLTGIAKEGLKSWHEKSRLHIPHNTWCGESQWKTYSLPELGLTKVASFSTKRISYGSTGTWSTSEYLAMGCFENTECGTMLFWQIEHNGSWHCEISDIQDQLYLKLSGPTENENHWWKNLRPGEKFVSVPIAAGVVSGGFERAICELTRYRRMIRRHDKDNEILPVIFNDYMHCIWADPTVEKELPLIDAAAEAGCEYYCIDAGWYAEGTWWNSVGEWYPSVRRFPAGIREMLDYIRTKGMIPGLWLEIEVMGVNCPIAKKVPDKWFFQRHGKRVVDHGRYQLDFRNSEVINYVNDVIDRVVNDYGAGFIKIDYNINSGLGTEIDADSFGDGLLGHNRAYIAWLDDVFKRYPGLLVEHCSSGGMRTDYALLGRHCLQSVTDQTDYRKNAVIAVSCPAAVTPEQSGIWSYPGKNADREEVVFNIINGMLARLYMSGAIADISPESYLLVVEGIRYYKTIRNNISKGLPFWPLGLPSFSDGWTCLGLKCGDKSYLAIWRLDSCDAVCRLHLNFMKGCRLTVTCSYPSYKGCEYEWDEEEGIMVVAFPQKNCARFFEINMITGLDRIIL
ncbi:MAG: alpha-galactosidase [Clostridiales bacterium]|nr:alpha-galactosidase [Clostridiales bacterium]